MSTSTYGCRCCGATRTQHGRNRIEPFKGGAKLLHGPEPGRRVFFHGFQYGRLNSRRYVWVIKTKRRWGRVDVIVLHLKITFTFERHMCGQHLVKRDS